MFKNSFPAEFDLFKMNHSEFITNVDKLIAAIKKDGFKPDIVVGVARGGIFPASYLSYYFEAEMFILYWQTRDGNRKDFALLSALAVAAQRKKILFVDDMCDSGKTFQSMVESSTFRQIEQEHLENLRSAVLVNNTGNSNSFEVDYSAFDINKDDYTNLWVEFPWEVSPNVYEYKDGTIWDNFGEWKPPVKPKMWYEVDGCTCPKLENSLLPKDAAFKIIDHNCPVHGKTGWNT